MLAILSLISDQPGQAWQPPFMKGSLPDRQPDMRGCTRTGVKRRSRAAWSIDPQRKESALVSRVGRTGALPSVFGQVGQVLRGTQARPQRRTGIIDPPDRKLPWKPEEDAKRRQHLLRMNPPVDLRHVELNARCALPGPFEGEDNANPYTILQKPGEVVILYDYNHKSRAIHLDRKEHLGQNIRLFMGDSIGHWEGNTLVVDTTNFNGRIAYSRELPYLTDALHLSERFTIADASTIDYEVTIDDPKLFTKPWKVAGYFSRSPKGTEPLDSRALRARKLCRTSLACHAAR
jgi:hypothetical protein